MADDGEPEKHEYLASAYVSNSKGKLLDVAVGGNKGFHPTHDAALKAIIDTHAKSKFKGFVH